MRKIRLVIPDCPQLYFAIMTIIIVYALSLQSYIIYDNNIIYVGNVETE